MSFRRNVKGRCRASCEPLELRQLLAVTLAIDSAGGPTTDSTGQVYAKDAGFIGGSANTDVFAVANTTDDVLYAQRRTGTFSYANSVPNGDYTLRLLFTDHYSSAGTRKFNVSVEDQAVLTNYDIVAEVGSRTATSKSFPVTITDGKLDMTFQSVVGYATLSAFELITDDSEPPPPPPPPPDEPPSLSIDDVSIVEGNSGTKPLVFTVTRTGATSSTSSVRFATQNQTAGEGDYGVTSGTLSFAAGQTSQTISITIKGDTKPESAEIFRVHLSSPSGATIDDGIGLGRIGNDDGIPGTNIDDITWTRNAPRSPLSRTEGGAVQVGSKLYVIGGFANSTGDVYRLTRRVHVYDMVARSWSELASLPSEAPGNHSGITSDGTYIYVVAGQIENTYGRGTETAWRYDIAADKWSQFVSLPEIRFGGTSFILNGQLHYVGGNEEDRETVVDTHWAFDLSNPEAGWVEKEPIPLSGDHISSAVINGKAYVFGGEHGHAGLYDEVPSGTYIQHNYTFEYDPANDSWTRKANIPLALSHVESATLVINGKAVLIGGALNGAGTNATNRVHVFDPAANTWKTLSTRYPKRILGAEAGYWNGKVYMTDGFSGDEADRQVGFEGTVKFV